MLESRCGLLAPREESGPKTTNENSSSQTTADGSDTAWQDAQHNRPAGQCGGFRIGLSSYELGLALPALVPLPELSQTQLTRRTNGDREGAVYRVRLSATLLHGSAGWSRGPGEVGEASPFPALGCRRAVQSQC